MNVPRIALVKQHNLNKWMSSGNNAGHIGPYGLEHLRNVGFNLAWSDTAQRPIANARGIRRLRSAAESKPPFRGLANAVASAPSVLTSDLILSMFEDQGSAVASLARRGVRPFNVRPHVLIACWLAQDLPSYNDKTLRLLSASYSTLSKCIVFSSNQVDVLEQYLNLPPEKIVVCPFGVSVDYFSQRPTRTLPYESNIDILAVGRDQSRDYETFCEAVRGTSFKVTLICKPENILHLAIPENVQVMYDVSHADYRSLLHQAKIVVTPTRAPAYPAGQTVLLEAMAAGAANIVTDSRPIRDYVRDGYDALTVPPRDVRALRTAMNSLLSHEKLRLEVATRASMSARKSFNHATMWMSIGNSLKEVLDTDPRAGGHP